MFAKLETLFAATTLVAGVFAGAQSCPSDTPLSCSSGASYGDVDTCCVNSPGGMLLQTQFWDSAGPHDSWTIHGLWPDECNGQYQSNCDPGRQYSNISAIIGEANPELLSNMKTYWSSDEGSAESFWEHEWNKHGTCVSTLEPKCFTDYKPQEDVVAYFEATINLFQNLNTYQWLEQAGITPNANKKYHVDDILSAIEQGFGHRVSLTCEHDALSSISYYFQVKGSVAGGQYIGTSPDGSKSSCHGEVYYNPKNYHGY